MSAKPTTNSTMHVSFQMFNDGMGIGEIAVKRSLAPATIETHLAAFVSSGELPITRLMTQEKLDTIITTIKQTGQTAAMKPVKDLLGEEYTFGEIRLALAYYVKREQSASPAS